MKTKLISMLLLLSMIISCKKDQQSVNSKSALQNSDSLQTLSLAQVKDWYGKNASTPSNTNSLNATSTAGSNKTFALSSVPFAWEKAQSVNNTKGNYWLVYLDGQPKFKNVKQGYRKLAFIRDSTGKIQSRILEIIPDAIYLQRKQKATVADFTGRVFIYDQNYKLISGDVYGNGKLMGKIKPKLTSSATTQTSTTQPSKFQTDEVSVQQDCQWNDSSYIDGDGVFTVYSELDCTTTIYDDGGGSGGGGGYTGSTGDAGGGGGGTGSSSSPASQPSNLPGENKDAVNPKALMKCFGNITDPNAKMTVTVYVEEPWPGTSFDIGPNSVGHVAIGLTKSSGSTSITQTVGFYPNATGYAKLNAPSKIVDNGGDLNYNVSISYSVSATQFNQITNYVANPPGTYDLNTFNCTNFVSSACQAGGITIPDAMGVVGLNGATMSLDKAMTPAHLGGSIEDMKGQSNVNTTGGYTPNSSGPCN
ncbi:hypothetical protein [Mucilaginibacter sp.]|uniref:hypothetical protein n=1 Tax=Mucilaginibacter sp. TaxID=1882438 RepID=UPI0025EDF524|nr:hypothetical protein [Mucilaginibacter sp.]